MIWAWVSTAVQRHYKNISTDSIIQTIRCHHVCSFKLTRYRAIAKMTARCALYRSYSTLVLFLLTATILCADFDSERI